MIAIIAAIAELLFFSVIAAITAMVAIIWKPGFREREKLHISAFWFPYDRYDRLKVFSIWSLWSLRSLTLFFSQRSQRSYGNQALQMTFLVVNPLKNEWFIDFVLVKKFEQNLSKIYINTICLSIFFSHPINSSSDKRHSKIIYTREFWRLPSSAKTKFCVHQT